GALFFVPFLGVAIGAGLGAIMGRVTKAGMDNDFRDRVRDMVQPGTSALFLMVDKIPADKAVDALSQYGGTVLRSSLSEEQERDVRDARQGGAARATPAPPQAARACLIWNESHVRPSGAPAGRRGGRGPKIPATLER